MNNIISLTTDTSKAARNVHPLDKSWAIEVHARFKDGMRPLHPGDPRRDEYARHLAPIRPHFNIDEAYDDGTPVWEPDVLGRFYLHDIVTPKLPPYPLTPTWAEKVAIALDYDAGVASISLESKNYAPPQVRGDDGEIAITFIQTFGIVFDPTDPKFNHDAYPAAIGAFQSITPVSVYPCGIECAFDPDDMLILASALEDCTRDARDAAGL